MFRLEIGMMSAMSRRFRCYCCYVKAVVIATLIVVDKSKKKKTKRERERKEKKELHERTTQWGECGRDLFISQVLRMLHSCLFRFHDILHKLLLWASSSLYPPPTIQWSTPIIRTHTHLPLPLLNLSG